MKKVMNYAFSTYWKKLKVLLLIMRLISFLILVGTLTVSANSYSQQTKLDLRLKNSSIENILLSIENNSRFIFIYDANIINTLGKKTIEAKGQRIETILDHLFEGTEVAYRVDDRQVFLFQKDNLSDPLLSKIRGNQQLIEIRGTINDPDGNPLPGVTVVIKGTTQGTITDIDGNYSLNNVPDDATLVFSFVGMKTQENPVAGKSLINVTMAEDAIGIDEVVAVGYGTMKRANLTGSVAAVSGDELTIVPSTNTAAMVAGRLPGLIVHQTSGQPGADEANVSVRGFGRALVLVDGVERNFTQLDPNEIESISILKDASAAIYGARAGNGVILVTTKRGQDGAPKISLNSSYSSSQPTAFPDYVNAYQFASMLTYAEGGVGPGSTYSQEDLDKFKQGNEPGYVGTDWKKVVMREWAPQQLHNLNVRGGNENTKYYLNLGYLNQGSIWKSGDGIYQRLNVSSNVDVKISDKLNASVDLNWRREDRDDPRNTLAIFRDLAFANPTVDRTNFPNPELNQVISPTRPTENNTVARTFQDVSGFIKDKRDIFNGAISLKYELPVKGLSVDGKVALNSFNRINNNFANEFEVWSYDYENQILSSAGFIGEKSSRKQSYRSQIITTQLALRYDRNFNNHYISGLLLNEMINEQEDNFWASRNDLISGTLPYLFAGNVETQLNGDYVSEDGRQSLVGRLNYGFKGKYLAELSFRYDGSPRFPKDKRWGFFPGVSVGWRISEESFIDDKIFDNLKLRASVGRSGFDGISTYDYLTGYQLTTGNNNVTILGDQTLAQLQSIGLANKNITWETIDLYNVGIDASILNGFLGMELDAFYRKRGGILANRSATISNTFGATLPAKNINSMDNRGFEILLTHRNKIGDFSYNIWHFSKNR